MSDIGRRDLFKLALKATGGAVATAVLPTVLLAEETKADVVGELILPYRGKMLADVGAFYCPYIPLVATSAQIVEGAITATKFVTRYDLSEFQLAFGIQKA